MRSEKMTDFVDCSILDLEQLIRERGVEGLLEFLLNSQHLLRERQ